ncbi:PREDICTED: L10-interacting MYB domain-containing protein-like isoform X2 [Nelumbo nucifera]|nr:PREDICTED: L10-interacting MYB domain-containing protein-like isoform X2 [Nelumbo nucifera]XP_010279317.1 PREDICTED: L10-interacting MYB domain-containing protein-like isoform X2 [Nelumbo nucifera]
MSTRRTRLPSFDNALTSPANWTVELENMYIDIMVEHVKRGDRNTTTFSKPAWKQIRQKFYFRTGNKYDLKQFKNKFNQLRTRYRVFKKLLTLPPGFHWDPVLRTPTAPDDVWDNYIKDNPDAKRFRKAGCPEYDKLGIIYGDSSKLEYIADKNNQDLILADTDLEQQREGDLHSDTPPSAQFEANLTPNLSEDVEGDLDDDIHQRSNMHSHSRRGKREKINTEMSDAIKFMAQAYNRRIDTLVEHAEKYSIGKCIKILENMEGLPMRTYLKATKMFQEQGWRETFIEMSEDRRKGWLEAVMSGEI